MIVGAQMRAVLRYVQTHPGCSKGEAAAAASLRSRRAGYAAVERCVAAGLLTASRAGRAYECQLTELGRAVIR